MQLISNRVEAIDILRVLLDRMTTASTLEYIVCIRDGCESLPPAHNFAATQTIACDRRGRENRHLKVESWRQSDPVHSTVDAEPRRSISPVAIADTRWRRMRSEALGTRLGWIHDGVTTSIPLAGTCLWAGTRASLSHESDAPCISEPRRCVGIMTP